MYGTEDGIIQVHYVDVLGNLYRAAERRNFGGIHW